MIGQPAPGFTLPDLSGGIHPLGEYLGRIVILNFWSAECPWSARADKELIQFLAEWGEDVALLTIASNVNEPPDLLQDVASSHGLELVLHDTGSRVAGQYGAQTTPHLFVIDREGIMRYEGAFDDVTFRRRTPTQAYLKNAVEAVLAGRTPDPAQTPSYGCTIVRFVG